MKDFMKGLLAVGLVGVSWGISAGAGYIAGIKLGGAIANKIESKKSKNNDTEVFLNNIAKDMDNSFKNIVLKESK